MDVTEKTPFQLATGHSIGRKMTVHLALTDPSGDTVVIECIGGMPEMPHGKQFTVMTNSPPYDQQPQQLRHSEGLGGDRPLPGTTDAADRFVRGAYYVTHLPKPSDYRETVASALRVIRNISHPLARLLQLGGIFQPPAGAPSRT